MRKPNYQGAQEDIRAALMRCASTHHVTDPIEWMVIVSACVSAVMSETVSWSPFFATPEGRAHLINTTLEPLRKALTEDFEERAKYEAQQPKQ